MNAYSEPGLDGFEALAADLASQRLPPVAAWNPPNTGVIDIRITADGQWIHEGAPIRREAMVRLFSTILRREGDAYFLVTPHEKLRIAVDLAPFVAVVLVSSGAGRARQLGFRLNTGDALVVDGAHPLRIESLTGSPHPVPLVHVRDGLEASLSRPVYYELAELALAESGDLPVPGLWSCGSFFPLVAADAA